MSRQIIEAADAVVEQVEKLAVEVVFHPSEVTCLHELVGRYRFVVEQAVEALAAAIAAATPESLEALAEARERRRIRKLEDAVGALLHLRDQMDDFAELQVIAELAEPYDFAEVLRIVAHQAILDKAEQDAIRRLRDLMLDA